MPVTHCCRNFHPRPKLRAYLRRRRWVRHCKIVTSGPFKEVGQISLQDLSLAPVSQTDHVPPGVAAVALWAVSSDGDVMARVGVTSVNAQVAAYLLVNQQFEYRTLSLF